jgi:biotin carboxyl carrier protein
VTDEEYRIDGHGASPNPAWDLAWIDRAHGEAILRRGEDRREVLVEGGPEEWIVTIDGRQIGVVVRGHRQRLLVESSRLAGRHRGPADVRATLPGKVVRIAVSVGEVVADGHALLTLEAMKMQNEIRTAHGGRIVAIEVTVGQTVATGAVLVRLVESEP